MLGGQKLYYKEFNITVLQYADKQVQIKKKAMWLSVLN